MKNKLIIENDDDKIVCQPLLKITTEEEEYFIYTKNEKNNCGDTVCYVASYNFLNGKQTLTPIENIETVEFLDSILLQVQSLINKKERVEKNGKKEKE